MFEIGKLEEDTQLLLGEWPGYKRPTIGIREGSVITSLGWFRNQKDFDRFMEALCEVFTLRIPEEEE